MKNLSFLLFFLSVQGLIAQHVGINTETPTEALDVNGGARFRDLPTIGKPKYVISADDTGRAYRWPYDSVQQPVGSTPSIATTISLVSGDTIQVGDCVSLGDGLSGVLRISTYNFPYTNVPINTNAWIAETFFTGPKAVGIKAIIVDVDIQATTPASFISCSIRAVSSGKPVGADIGVAIVEGPSGVGTSNTFCRMVFDPPVVITPNTTYALIMRTNMSGSFVNVHTQSLGMYSAGYACVSSNAGTTWTTQLSVDLNCMIFVCETKSGKAYRSDISSTGGNAVGWNTTVPCFEGGNCQASFFGKNDQYDNIIGIAQNGALPGQTVLVQTMGKTNLPPGFPLGRKLYTASPPGSLSVSNTQGKSVGFSTGDGMIIQVIY